MNAKEELDMFFDEPISHIDPGSATLFDYESLFGKHIETQYSQSMSNDVFKCNEQNNVSYHTLHFVQQVMADGSASDGGSQETEGVDQPAVLLASREDHASCSQLSSDLACSDKQRSSHEVEPIEELPTYNPCNDELGDLGSYLNVLESVGQSYGAVKVKLPEGWRQIHMRTDASRLRSLKFHCKARTIRESQVAGCWWAEDNGGELKDFMELQDKLSRIEAPQRDGEKTWKATADTFSLFHEQLHTTQTFTDRPVEEEYPCIVSLGCRIAVTRPMVIISMVSDVSSGKRMG
eukprot:753290-Hanusia_phi.AAC.10